MNFVSKVNKLPEILNGLTTIGLSMCDAEVLVLPANCSRTGLLESLCFVPFNKVLL